MLQFKLFSLWLLFKSVQPVNDSISSGDMMHFTLLILRQGFICIWIYITSILIVDASPQKKWLPVCSASVQAHALWVLTLHVMKSYEQAPFSVWSLKHLLPPDLQYVQHCVSERTHLWIWPKYHFTAYDITFERLKQKSRHCDFTKASEPQMKWI